MAMRRTTGLVVLATLLAMGCEGGAPLDGGPALGGAAPPKEGNVRVVGKDGVITPVSSAWLKTWPLGGAHRASQPANGVDGDPRTVWASVYDPAGWLLVDLGGARTIDRMVVRWGAGYGETYDMEASDDRETWRVIRPVAGGDGDVDDLPIAPTTARYVRMRGKRALGRYGRFEVGELEVYGPDAPTRNLARLAPVEASSILWLEPPAGYIEAARRARDAADAKYRAGDFRGARDGYLAILKETGAAHWGGVSRSYDTLRYHLQAAEFRLRQPAAKPRRTLHMTVFTVPKVDATHPRGPTDLSPLRFERTIADVDLAFHREQLFWLGEAFLALTDGAVGWSFKYVTLPTTVVAGVDPNWEPASNRFKSLPSLQHWKPAPWDGFLAELDADLFYVLWPGIVGHPLAVDHGAIAEYTFVRGARQHRRKVIYSDAQARPGADDFNTTGFLFHEIQHWLDDRYPDLPYPHFHGGLRPDEWPAGFVGRTEAEFHEQTLKRFYLPADGLARMAEGAAERAADAAPQAPTAREVIAPRNVTDGDDATRWASAGPLPQWIYVDLGATRTVDRVKLRWTDEHAMAYRLQRYDGATWRTSATVTAGTGGETVHAYRAAVRARYLRVSATAAVGRGVGLRAFEVYGAPTGDQDLARSRKATASSTRQGS